MWREKGTVYLVRYRYRRIGSKGFHTSIIYGAAGLMYGRHRGFDEVLRNYGTSKITPLKWNTGTHQCPPSNPSKVVDRPSGPDFLKRLSIDELSGSRHLQVMLFRIIGWRGLRSLQVF